MKSHPDIGDLPQCRNCTGRDWHHHKTFADDRRDILVFNCLLCGRFGVARDETDSAHVDFDGAFDV